MKKNVYLIIITIITCICCVAGIAIHTFHFFSSFGFLGNYTDNTVNVSPTELDEYANIDLNMDITDLKIIEGESFSIIYDGVKDLQPIYSIENDTLTIHQKNGKKYKWGLRDLKCNVILTIPKHTDLENISISLNAGDIEMKSITAASTSFFMNAGDLDISNTEGGDLTIEVDAGDIEISNCNFKNSSIDANAGDIDIYDSNLTSGKVCVNAGDIDVENTDFDDMTLDCNMGEIDVTLPLPIKEYDIQTDISLGEININEQKQTTSYKNDNGTHKLKVTCDMGEIEINGK